LHLATTHTQARFVLPSAIAQLSRRYPNVSVRLETLADGDVLPQLARGTVDMAILSTTGAAPSGGHAVPLYRWHRVVLVPSHHPLALLERAPTLAELVRHPLLTYQSFNHPESSLRRALQAQNLAPNVAMSAPDADLIKTYVRAGLGVGIVAEMAVHPVQDADLRVLPAPDVLPTCITWAVVPRERVLRQFVTDCIRLLAPDLDAHDLRRVLAGHQEPRWPDPPQYAVRRLAPLRGELPRSFV
jgi:DNA-binding transcriptional LysR family regulator